MRGVARPPVVCAARRRRHRLAHWRSTGVHQRQCTEEEEGVCVGAPGCVRAIVSIAYVIINCNPEGPGSNRSCQESGIAVTALGRLSSQSNNSMGYARFVGRADSDPGPPNNSFDHINDTPLPLCYLRIWQRCKRHIIYFITRQHRRPGPRGNANAQARNRPRRAASVTETASDNHDHNDGSH